MSILAVEKIGSIQPNLVERACGGWLAVAPESSPVRIGVTAETEDQARERFSATLREWVGLLEKKTT